MTRRRSLLVHGALPDGHLHPGDLGLLFGVRAVSLLILLLPLAASAQDPVPGRALYEAHCGGCHYERVHDRLRTEVKDLSDLRDMVARWAPQTKRAYSLDELESIVQYLNQSHYRFGLSPRRTP